MPIVTTTLISIVIVLLVAYYFVPLATRKYVSTALLFACTLNVGFFFLQMLRGQSQQAAIVSTVGEDRAEMTLRMMTTLNVGISKMFAATGLPTQDKHAKENKSILEISSENLGNYFKEARSALDGALKASPNSASLKGKQVILACMSNSKSKEAKKYCQELMASADPDECKLGFVLNSLLMQKAPPTKAALPENKVSKTDSSKRDNSDENAKTETELSNKPDAPANSNAKASTNTKVEKIGNEALSHKNGTAAARDGKTGTQNESTNANDALNQNAETALSQNDVSTPAAPKELVLNYAEDIRVIEKEISKGWYQDSAKLLLMKYSKHRSELKTFAAELEQRYYDKFALMLSAMTIGLIGGFIGLVVIVIFFGSLGRKDPKSLPPDDLVGIPVDLKTVYAVFAGWLTTEIALAQLFKMLPKNLIHMGANPLSVSAFSMLSYLVTMIPAILILYFVALKPNGFSFTKSLRLRAKTSTSGPVKLIMGGFLSWCAIIPMVFISAIIASKYLGSQGSDNPVLAQISAVANSKDLLAVVILYLTVAGLAPFFEEILFRGFLYSALKSKYGIFPAVLASALVFALIHFDKGGTLMLLALGPVLAISYDRSRSLLPPMIAHGLWNGGSFAMAVSLYL